MTAVTALILAAGTGSRLEGGFGGRPKAFISIGGQTLIERSMTALSACGITTVVIGIGHKAAWFDSLREKKSGPQLQMVHNAAYDQSGSLETLCLLRDYVRGDMVVLESDLIYEPRAVSNLLTDARTDLLLASGATHAGDEVFVSVDATLRLVALSKDKWMAEAAWGEFVGITKLSLEAFRKICLWRDAQGVAPTPRHYEEGLVSLSAVHPIYVKKIPDLVWGEIDTREHLNRVEETVLPRLKKYASVGPA